MVKYRVTGEYLLPEFFEVEIDAVSGIEAADKAYEEIEKLNPEALEIQINDAVPYV